jgi:hypothetical protein
MMGNIDGEEREREREERQQTYQIKCLPFGIPRTAYTGPDPCGNLKILAGSLFRVPRWWMLYSSTVPFLRPA